MEAVPRPDSTPPPAPNSRYRMDYRHRRTQRASRPVLSRHRLRLHWRQRIHRTTHRCITPLKHMGVNLRRFNVPVPHQLPNVVTGSKQVFREVMAQLCGVACVWIPASRTVCRNAFCMALESMWCRFSPGNRSMGRLHHVVVQLPMRCPIIVCRETDDSMALVESTNAVWNLPQKPTTPLNESFGAVPVCNPPQGDTICCVSRKGMSGLCGSPP